MIGGCELGEPPVRIAPVTPTDVPLALRAAQLKGIVPTINKFYDVHVEFFETDSRNRQSNFFSAKIVDGGAAVTGLGGLRSRGLRYPDANPVPVSRAITP